MESAQRCELVRPLLLTLWDGEMKNRLKDFKGVSWDRWTVGHLEVAEF